MQAGIDRLNADISQLKEKGAAMLNTPDTPAVYTPDSVSLPLSNTSISSTTRSFRVNQCPVLSIEFDSGETSKIVYITNSVELMQQLENAEAAQAAFRGKYGMFHDEGFGDWDTDSYEDAAITFLDSLSGSFSYSEIPISEILKEISDS